MQHLSRYVSGLLFFGILTCLLIPVSAESITFGYQPDPIQFSETENSYILNNSELEIEFFKDTLGYNQYRNARNSSVLIYDARTWVDYLGPGNKWKPADIAQTTSYRQIYRGYEVTRHYEGIQADYDVVYIWVENRPCKHTIYITGKVEDDFQVSESYDGVVGTSKIENKSVYAGDNYNLIISIHDVIKSFGTNSVDVTETTSASGKKFDYTFGSWELDFSDMANGSHQIMVDPSVTFNGSNSWAGTSGPMLEHGDGHLRNEPYITTDLISYYSFEAGTGNTAYDVWGDNDGVITNAVWNTSGKYGGTLYYDGTAYVIIADSVDFDTTNATILVWVNRSDNTQNYYEYFTKVTSTAVRFVGYGDRVANLFKSYIDTVASAISSSSSASTDKYIHIGNRIDGTNQQLIINSTQEATIVKNHDFSDISGQICIGAYNGTADYWYGYIDEVYIYGSNLSDAQILKIMNNYHSNSSYRQIDNAQDAGVNQVHKYVEVLGTDPSANTSLSLWVNGSDDNVTFNGLEQVNASFNAGDNVTIDIAYEYRYAKFIVYSNTTYQPETNIISNITITSALALLPPQNLTNITEQTQICFNWDDYVSADKWNISQRIPSIPYTDVNIILDGVKDAEFTDRAHTWILDSPNPTGTNGNKESISWIRNSTTLSGYADGEDNDALNNDDSFTIMLDMTANNLTTDDRQFILKEGGGVIAKRWGGADWLPQATNAVGVVVGAGVAGSIQYEMQIPISELSSFTNGSTIKLAMAREDSSQNPDVTKYYPKGLINDTDATIWTSINLTAESEYTFLGNTTLSNYTVTGLTAFTWYRHRFSTINGSTESLYVYSNDVTKDSPQYNVSGYILTNSGLPISGASVWSLCSCGCVCEVETSNATGYYEGDCFYNGTYNIYASKDGYDTNYTTVVVNGTNLSNVNVTLSPSEDVRVPLPIFISLTLVVMIISRYSLLYVDTENFTDIIAGAFAFIIWCILGYIAYSGIAINNVISTEYYTSGVLSSSSSEVVQKVYQYEWIARIYILIGIIILLHTIIKSIGMNRKMIEEMEDGYT